MTATLSLGLDFLGEFDQPFGGVGAAIEQDVFDAFPQFRFDFFVNSQLAGIHNAHVEPGPNGMKQKRGMHRFADRVVSAERERNIADAAADLGAGQIAL